MPTRLPTLAFTPNPALEYDPLADILSGKKVHTLRKQRMHGDREVTLGRKRTGVVLRMTGHRRMASEEFMADEFARSDGLPDAGALEDLLVGFYGYVPGLMWLNEFEVVRDGAGDGGDDDAD